MATFLQLGLVRIDHRDSKSVQCSAVAVQYMSSLNHTKSKVFNVGHQ